MQPKENVTFQHICVLNIADIYPGDRVVVTKVIVSSLFSTMTTQFCSLWYFQRHVESFFVFLWVFTTLLFPFSADDAFLIIKINFWSDNNDERSGGFWEVCVFLYVSLISWYWCILNLLRSQRSTCFQRWLWLLESLLTMMMHFYSVCWQ